MRMAEVFEIVRCRRKQGSFFCIGHGRKRKKTAPGRKNPARSCFFQMASRQCPRRCYLLRPHSPAGERGETNRIGQERKAKRSLPPKLFGNTPSSLLTPVLPPAKQPAPAVSKRTAAAIPAKRTTCVLFSAGTVGAAGAVSGITHWNSITFRNCTAD